MRFKMLWSGKCFGPTLLVPADQKSWLRLCTEADTMRETAVTEDSVDEVQDQSTRIPMRRKRWFEDDFFYYE